MRAVLALLLATCPTWAEADHELQRIEADLDRDGRVETYELQPSVTVPWALDLVVTEDAATRVFPDLTTLRDEHGRLTYLDLDPEGLVRVIEHNDAVGLHRWYHSLTIAHHDGALRVVRVGGGWTRTIDPDAHWGSCEVDLLTGRGRMRTADGERAITVAPVAPLLEDWQYEGPESMLPEACS